MAYNSESKKKVHSIYLIDKQKVTEKYGIGEEYNTEDIAVAIVNNYPKKYTAQIAKDSINTEGFEIAMYYRKEKPSNKLNNFCKDFLKEDSAILKAKPMTLSTVLFVWSKKNLFVITTGQGFRVVEEFCVNRFGIIALSLYDGVRITAMDSNNISGIVHSSKTIYTNEMNFIDVESLDTIYKEITGRMNDKKTVHKLLDLDPEAKKSSLKVIAKNSIQFSSSLDFHGLINLLTLLDKNDYSELTDGYNSITPIQKKKHKSLLKEIKNEVITSVYESVDEDKPFNFDLFNRLTIPFIGAEEYGIQFNGKEMGDKKSEIIPNEFINSAFKAFLDGKESTKEEFSIFFNQSLIVAYKDGFLVTSGSLMDHLSGEIEFHGKNYYLFYGEFYQLNDSYNNRLDKLLRRKLEQDKRISLLTTSWNTGVTEDDFNKTVSENEGFIHLHRILEDNIEFADLLKIENGYVNILHVKDGFDKDMRALDRQIELSISKLIDLKSNNNDCYFRALYNKAKSSSKGRNITTDFTSVDDFVKALKDNEPRYIAVIHPPNKDLLKSSSNIAKHCLNALILRCNNQGISFKINVV